MSRPRKNIEVEPLLDWANEQLKRTDEYADTGFKSGICVMIERILLDAGQYNGYSHNTDNPEFGSHDYFCRTYYMLKRAKRPVLSE